MERESERERGFKNVHTNVRQQRNSPGREDGDPEQQMGTLFSQSPA